MLRTSRMMRNCVKFESACIQAGRSAWKASRERLKRQRIGDWFNKRGRPRGRAFLDAQPRLSFE